MGDRFVLPPDEVPAYDPAAARTAAADYLASQGVPGYSQAPVASSAAEPPPVEAGPPPPPKPGVGASIKEGLKKAAITTGAALFGGPVGAFAAGQAALNPGGPPPKTEEEAPPPATETPGQSPPPTSTQDAPIMLQQQGAGRMVTPAGMYPESSSVSVHQGREVPREAKAASLASTELGFQGAEAQRDADREYYKQLRDTQYAKMAATTDAIQQHQAVQAERQSMVQDRLNQIEALNQQAAADIDPQKYWNDKTAGARVMGTIAIALGGIGDRLLGRDNGALKIFDNAVNQDIQAQMANRQQAGQAAGRQQNLLQLHLEQLGDRDKAIDATKLALYDNILGQIDAYKADHDASVSEANYLKTRSDLLAQRAELVNKMGLQEQDDINKQATEHWHNATYAGGGAGTATPPDFPVITIPASDKTGEKETHVAVDKSVFPELSAMQGQTNELVTMNNTALDIRKQLRAATDRLAKGDLSPKNVQLIATLRDRLKGMNNDRATLAEKAKDPNSAVRDPEFQRALESGIDYTGGFLGNNTVTSGDVEKQIEGNSNLVQNLTDARLRGASGQVVKPAIGRDKNQFIVNGWLPTGERYRGRAVGSEKK